MCGQGASEAVTEPGQEPECPGDLAPHRSQALDRCSPCSPTVGRRVLQTGVECTERQQWPAFHHTTSRRRQRGCHTREASPRPDHSPVKAPQEANTSFLLNKLILSLLHASNDKLAVLRQCKPESKSWRSWKMLGGSLVQRKGQALRTPNPVQAPCLSRQLPLSPFLHPKRREN